MFPYQYVRYCIYVSDIAIHLDFSSRSLSGVARQGYPHQPAQRITLNTHTHRVYCACSLLAAWPEPSSVRYNNRLSLLTLYLLICATVISVSSLFPLSSFCSLSLLSLSSYPSTLPLFPRVCAHSDIFSPILRFCACLFAHIIYIWGRSNNTNTHKTETEHTHNTCARLGGRTLCRAATPAC
jgi:hypothetical protein